jgi:hypothetical protein
MSSPNAHLQSVRALRLTVQASFRAILGLYVESDGRPQMAHTRNCPCARREFRDWAADLINTAELTSVIGKRTPFVPRHVHDKTDDDAMISAIIHGLQLAIRICHDPI